MNLSTLLKVLASKEPQKEILKMMSPQQQKQAQEFLESSNPNEALGSLMKQYNVSDAQVNDLLTLVKK